MEEVAPGIFIETGYQGVNVGAVVMSQGIVCVDAPSFPREARHWATNLSQLHRWHARYLILTSSHGDRILNTRWLDAPIISHHLAAEKLFSYDRRYPQHLLDNLSQRSPESGRELVSGPVERPAMSFSQRMAIMDDSLTAKLLSRPGPSLDNIWVYLPEAKVLFTGDSVVNGTFPPLAEMSIGPWLHSLRALVAGDLAVEKLIPGRGKPSGVQIVETLVAFLERMKSTLTNHIAEEQPREEVTTYLDEFMAMLPLGDLPRDWVRWQLRLGLERNYDELQVQRATAKGS